MSFFDIGSSERESYRENENRNLKKLFSGKIKENFLIKIKDSVMSALGEEIFPLYEICLEKYDTRVLTGDLTTPQYEICRMIVGTHRHNCIFLTEEQTSDLQKSQDYCEKLVSQVVEKIRLRGFAAKYFRKRPLRKGDEFLYFSVPYYLFALCTKGISRTCQHIDQPVLFEYNSILENAIDALTIMENNHLSGAYPICRGIIELFLKIWVIRKNPKCYEHYRRFRDYEISQSCCEKEYPDKFIEEFKNRKVSASKNKVAYLHYGWLDNIPNYNNKMPDAYTVSGLLRYLLSIADSNDKKTLEGVESLYKSCHAYAHGSASYMKYPLVQYFELSSIMYDVLTYVFPDIFRIMNEDIPDEDKNLLDILSVDFEMLKEQVKKVTDKNLKEYYRIYPAK